MQIMRQSEINYTASFYEGDKPYRDSLIAALKHYGLDKFKKEEEFWTLGAKEWHEYNYLVKNGIQFSPGTYHNVDRGDIDENPDSTVVRHPHCEFFDIHKLWNNPRAICFDSTMGILNRNQVHWDTFIDLACLATKTSGKVFLTWNFMTTYGNLPFRDEDWTSILKRYQYWLGLLINCCKYDNLQHDLFEQGICAPKEGSTTLMLCGHALLKT